MKEGGIKFLLSLRSSLCSSLSAPSPISPLMCSTGNTVEEDPTTRVYQQKTEQAAASAEQDDEMMV
jgi:hypothetical protein